MMRLTYSAQIECVNCVINWMFDTAPLNKGVRPGLKRMAFFNGKSVCFLPPLYEHLQLARPIVVLNYLEHAFSVQRDLIRLGNLSPFNLAPICRKP